jgi:non-ribosomal peptide synthetase component F
VNRFVKEYKITSAALFNCTWGILLRKYTNNEDIIFGTTVSARNARIKEIENMVGLFINTLPLRMRIYSDKKIIDLLKDVQQSMQSREEYTYTSLAEIKNWSGIDFNRDIFDSIVVIENYPLDRIKGDRQQLHAIMQSCIHAISPLPQSPNPPSTEPATWPGGFMMALLNLLAG